MSDQSMTVSRVEVTGLGETQAVAFEALRAGSTFPQAANAAGVSRGTIYRWVQSDPHFRAAYNTWKQEQVESAHARLLKLTDKAVDVVQGALEHGNQKVAVGVLQQMGVMHRARREPTDPIVLKLQMDLRRFQDQYHAAKALVEHLLTKAGFSPAEQKQFIHEHGIGTVTDADSHAAQVSELIADHADERAQCALAEAVRKYAGGATNPTPDDTSGQLKDETTHETTGETRETTGETN